MFDFRMPQECDSFVIGISPDGCGGKLKRIIELEVKIVIEIGE
jgi:hypothetical protein